MAEEYPRCPVCFSQIVIDPEEIEKLKEEGIYVWVEDPILTLRGLAGEEYKGKTPCRWLHIIQLQEARQQQEEDIGLEDMPEEPEEGKLYKTVFSEVKKREPVRRVHIEELRISTEKILETAGRTKEDYFNYDEEGNERRAEHQTEWIEPNLTLETPIRAIHIEDLRHPVPILSFLFLSNQWTEGYGQGERHLAKYIPSKEDGVPTLKLVLSNEAESIDNYVTVDDKKIYGISRTYVSGGTIWGYHWNRTATIYVVNISDLEGYEEGFPSCSLLTADENYIYTASYYWKQGVGWRLAIFKITKNLASIQFLEDVPISHFITSGVNDKNNIYVTTGINYMDKYGKENLNLISSVPIEENTKIQVDTIPVGPSAGQPLYEWVYWATQSIVSDDKYLYVKVRKQRQKEWISSQGPNWVYISLEDEVIYYLYKLDKNFSKIWVKQLGRFYWDGVSGHPIEEEGYRGEWSYFAVNNSYIYMLGLERAEPLEGYQGHIYIFDKDTFQKLKTVDNWKNGIPVLFNGIICCSDEYRFSQINEEE